VCPPTAVVAVVVVVVVVVVVAVVVAVAVTTIAKRTHPLEMYMVMPTTRMTTRMTAVD
jgi:hypothetical protein